MRKYIDLVYKNLNVKFSAKNYSYITNSLTIVFQIYIHVYNSDYY